MLPLVLVSLALFVVRLYAAGHVGYGDSEALYASWAVHPQPAYLDHPGLVGFVARLLGSDSVPPPNLAHAATAVVATLVPWIAYGAARGAGAEKERAALAAAFLAVVPEIAVGLFALTPDLLLAPLWLGALGLACWGATTKSVHATMAVIAAGLLAGVGASAKVPGLLLILALAVAYVDLQRSKLLRSLWPWAGLAAGLVVVFPMVQYEAHFGFPMLQHRLVATQEVGGSFGAHLGTVFGGQLVYLSPLVIWVAAKVAIDLVRHRKDDATSRILFWSFAIPIVPLFVLCVWSRSAEPHWIAPPLLALPIHAARRGLSVAYRSAAGTALAFTVVAHLWVLVPSAVKLFPKDVDPKADIATELYGWPAAIQAVKEQRRDAATPLDPEGNEVVVVGPHWTICGQLQAALPTAPVGCATPIKDDFDGWLPRDKWRNADTVLWVTDNRFEDDGAAQLPNHVRASQGTVRVMRGGRQVRVFSLYLYTRRAAS